MIVQAVFLAQALDEMQIGLVVLHAIFAIRQGLADLEQVAIRVNAMFLKNLPDDLRNAQVLKNPLIETMAQVRQPWRQGEVVLRQPVPDFAPANMLDLSMNAMPVVIEGQKGLPVHEAGKIDVRSRADQFDVEGVRLADGFGAGEGQHLQVVFKGVGDEAQTSIGIEHPLFLVL